VASLDLNGPLDEFYERTSHIRQTLSAVEALAAGQQMHSARPRADLDRVGLPTSNTANSMALVFLASTFEEFYRQEITQCAEYLGEKYAGLAEAIKLTARSSYWAIFTDRVRNFRSVTTVVRKVRQLDLTAVAEARAIVDSARGFALLDDASALDSALFADHTRNFRPWVVNEIGNRLGIQDVVGQAAEYSRVRSYFAESSKVEAARRLKLKLEEFYGIRNMIVHSLNSTSGYGVDSVFDYIDLFECYSDGIRAAISRHVSAW
jgi:hypothetical protein